ncbi:MAG: flagellar biosynthetic protein FliQ [Thiobacillaceae bacterium]
MEDLARQALWLTLTLAAPLLLAGLAVAFIVSLFQAATQNLEPTLSFVPKLLVMAAVLAVLGSWMGGRLIEFTQELLSGFPGLID